MMEAAKNAKEAVDRYREGRRTSETGRDLIVAANFLILWLMAIVSLIGVYIVDRTPDSLTIELQAIRQEQSDMRVELTKLRAIIESNTRRISPPS